MLLGNPPNEITSNAYISNHIFINLIMLTILTVAILSLCLLPKYSRKIKCRKKTISLLLLILFHLILPIFILLLVPIFFATPLWVAKAFVPDVFITIIISSTLLLLNGLIKSVILFRRCLRAYEHKL